MIVPSRSIKTAGDSASVMFAVLSKIGDKLISGDGRRSKFAHHNCASVVGDFRRLNRSRSADESKCEQRNGSIARAGYVENLPRLGGNVMRRFVCLKKHHALFTESDQNVFCFPSLEKRFASPSKIDIVRRHSIRIGAGYTTVKQSSGPIWFNYCDTMPLTDVRGIGISRHYFTGRPRFGRNL